MKRIISILSVIAALLASLSILSSCGKSNNDIPEGMQLVRGGEDVGYYFYGPEGWTIANQGDISTTYVSSVNYTSLSFVPLKPIQNTDNNFSYALYIKELFENDCEKYNCQPFSKFTVIESPQEQENGKGITKCTFGNASEAYKFIFS